MITLCLAAGCGPEADRAKVPRPVTPEPRMGRRSAEDRAATETGGRDTSESDAGFAFRAIGPESGLSFERTDDIRGLRRILEANGGGVALFDFDRDGRLDTYFTNGCRLPLSVGDGESRGELFRNRGGFRFESAAVSSGLIQHGYMHGCAVGDYDADGFDDLYLTAYGPDALWRNNGDGTLTPVTEPAGVAAPGWGSSAAFGDLEGDGDLDLYVVNYLDESDESPTLCPNPDSPDGYSQCPPAMFRGVDDVLYLSDGEGRFVDATASAGIVGTRGKGLGVVIADLGGDPRPEIFVANDGEANFLFAAASPPGEAIRYEERALTSGVALNESGYAQANMGVAVGDYDADGETDLFITHFFGDTSTLYDGRGGLAFEDATRSSGLGPVSRDRLGWGTVFFDPDNDGWLDLFVANGHVDDRTFMSHDEPYRMRPQVFRNRRDGSFADVSDLAGEYFRGEWLGRGVAAGDLDGDGRVDLAVSHQLAPSVLLRNETETGSASLILRLAGTASNRNGIGARLELRESGVVTAREIIGGGSYLSASALEAHFGLRGKDRAAVRLRWPSGETQEFDAAAGEWLVVEGRRPVRIP